MVHYCIHLYRVNPNVLPILPTNFTQETIKLPKHTKTVVFSLLLIIFHLFNQSGIFQSKKKKHKHTHTQDLSMKKNKVCL